MDTNFFGPSLSRVARYAYGRHISHTFTKFNFEIPAGMYRLAAVGTVASFIAIAVIYSRDGNVATEFTSKQAFIQLKDREQAEGRFTPTPKVIESEDKLIAANAFPLPRQRPVTPGFYYELVRSQGDGGEGEYVLVERECIPKVDMPQPCYLPERDRRNFPLRLE
jgi:hypothetical protein